VATNGVTFVLWRRITHPAPRAAAPPQGPRQAAADQPSDARSRRPIPPGRRLLFLGGRSSFPSMVSPEIAVAARNSQGCRVMSAHSRGTAFLPVVSIALGVVLSLAAPIASAKETVSASVATPRPLLRNGAGQIIDPVFGPPAPGQSVAC